MRLKAGTIFRTFTTKDNREVTLRVPTWNDLDDYYMNSIIDEQENTGRTITNTRDREADWLGRHLAAIESNKKLAIVAEVGGKMVGQVEVKPRDGNSSHIGVLGTGLLPDYRDIGIGTELMKEAEKQVGHIGVETLFLEVYATNSRAIHVYEKGGYRKTGVIPKGAKSNSDYIDLIQMVKEVVE